MWFSKLWRICFRLSDDKEKTNLGFGILSNYKRFVWKFIIQKAIFIKQLAVFEWIVVKSFAIFDRNLNVKLDLIWKSVYRTLGNSYAYERV